LSRLQRAGAGRYWPIWLAVLPVALWAGVRALGLEQGFPWVALIAFTPYVAVLALLVTGVATALRNWLAAVLAATATLCLLAAVLPRGLGDSSAAAPERSETLNVLSANVYRGKSNAAALLDIARGGDTDILAVQELSPKYARELEHLGIEQLFPHAVISVAQGESGGGIYSRFPLRRLARARPFSFRMPGAEAVLPRGRAVRIIDVHPYTPKRASDGRWEEGLRTLPSTGPRGTPWILPGDFNATLDHAELRAVLDRGYRDAADVTGQGLEPTWPVGDGLFPPPVTIDHVLADRRIGIAGYEVADLPGSDHRTVFARLVLP
jgi:endonuclease/exonuclease/phosphatase family metal-dependent hydrolase